MNVSREEAVRFLECATRNWSKVPPLSEDDLGDVATELLRFVIAHKATEWQDMSSAPLDGTEVIIACPCSTAPGQYIVSAASFNPGAYGGTWWWSGTQMGEWGDSPVEDTNEPPTFWQPMPAAPSANGGAE